MVFIRCLWQLPVDTNIGCGRVKRAERCRRKEIKEAGEVAYFPGSVLGWCALPLPQLQTSSVFVCVKRLIKRTDFPGLSHWKEVGAETV